MLTCTSFGWFAFFPRADLDDVLEALVRLQIRKEGPLWVDPHAAR